ncbi:hypothetical protein VIGAN_10097100 [Vigna angularis var. angularis]|nr:hypothetical protein VIGAN_10097100 [Vigna angularis var. angularis]
MDKRKSSVFSMMIARRKEELKKSGEGSSTRPPLPKSTTPSRMEKSVSSHKRSSRSAPEGPLRTGPLDLNVRIAHYTQFNLSPEEKKYFNVMTFEEATDIAYELSIRPNVCMTYVVGTPKGAASIEELQTAHPDLEVALKENEELNRHLEEAQEVSISHSGYDVMKMVVDGQLLDVPLSLAPVEEVSPVLAKEPQCIEVVVEDIEEEA